MDKDQYIAELKKRIDDLVTRNHELVDLFDDIRRTMVLLECDIDRAIGSYEQDSDCCNKDHNETTKGR